MPLVPLFPVILVFAGLVFAYFFGLASGNIYFAQDEPTQQRYRAIAFLGAIITVIGLVALAL